MMLRLRRCCQTLVGGGLRRGTVCEEEEEEDRGAWGRGAGPRRSLRLQLEAHAHFVSAGVEVLPVNQSREGDLDA